MKKISLLLMSALILGACGNNDKKKDADVPAAENVEAEKYTVIIEAIYEKDDSIAIVYQKDGYFQYETPVSLKVKGSPEMQKFSVDMPQGVAVENLSIVASTNKEQNFLTLKNVTVVNGQNVVNGDNYKHIEYFSVDGSFSWDTQKSRYNLSHANKYPPGMVGNDKLQSLLMK